MASKTKDPRGRLEPDLMDSSTSLVVAMLLAAGVAVLIGIFVPENGRFTALAFLVLYFGLRENI